MADIDSENKKIKDLKEYLEQKYGSAFLSAISKLNAQDIYDENGILKPEYVLSTKEKEALKLYIPGTKTFFENTDATLDQRFRAFLDDVRKSTLGVVSDFLPTPDGDSPIYYETADIDEFYFRSQEIKTKYGEDIYTMAREQVPKHGVFPDFSNANIKLGYIVKMTGNISGSETNVSQLIDLDYLVKVLAEKNISSFLDLETNTFHYNEASEKAKTM